MKFAIGIPTLNREDLLLTSLLVYGGIDFRDVDIYVLDNGNQNIPQLRDSIHIINKTSNIGVGASWNELINTIFKKYDNALILNDDVYLGKKTNDIEELIKKNKNRGLLRSTMDWCSFIMTKEIWNLVGEFDECFFPAYYEDKSYEYRMKLKNVMPIKSVALNPFIYKQSMTIEKMPSIIDYSIKNKSLYIDMWGGEPHLEKYITPFNNKKK